MGVPKELKPGEPFHKGGKLVGKFGIDGLIVKPKVRKRVRFDPRERSRNSSVLNLWDNFDWIWVRMQQPQCF